MKSQFLKSVLVVVLLSTFAFSCSDDENGKKNVLVVDGISLPVKQAYVSEGYQTEDGQGNLGRSFILTIPSSGVSIVHEEDYDYFEGNGYVIDLNLSAATAETLKDGTYTFQADGRVFPVISWFNFVQYADDNDVYLNGDLQAATVEVRKSGSKYTIDFEITYIVSGQERTVKGYYNGSLEEANLAS